MMKTERDKLKKKVWEKPEIKTLSVKNTFGGTLVAGYEGGDYRS